jgi:2-polyprenyl-6-hydroxyphenyl methylase/3-demethylubiquinone-9 3-methyltransferase
MNDPRLFYESIATDFDALMNPYDLARRLSIVFDELLPRELAGWQTLDLGCGTGWFSYEARQRGAHVISLDVSPSLTTLTRTRAQSQPVVGDGMYLPFTSHSFDLVIASEVIEHFSQPSLGLQEIARVLKPGGWLVLTTPNRRWLWLVNLATRLRLRPFEGYENFLGFNELEQLLIANGMQVESHRGFHPWPFQLKWLQRFSRFIDTSQGQGKWGAWMINQVVRARKSK